MGTCPSASTSTCPATRYITFLRDPVERTLSHYYRARSVRKRDPIPEDMSFEDVLAGGDYLYDNLQTRMLSADPEPFGEVTQEMLEQAKENLSERFISFGLADRFDESLVLLKRGLELNSILYVSQRMTTNRPRTQQSKEDLTPIAERFNAYDIELYRWASEQFDRRVADQDADFAVELAALKTAVSGGRVTESPPAASKLSRGQMWEELVRARAGLLGWEYQVAKANEPDQSLLEELHTLLKQANENIVQLQERSEAVGSRAGQAGSELGTHVEESKTRLRTAPGGSGGRSASGHPNASSNCTIRSRSSRRRSETSPRTHVTCTSSASSSACARSQRRSSRRARALHRHLLPPKSSPPRPNGGRHPPKGQHESPRWRRLVTAPPRGSPGHRNG